MNALNLFSKLKLHFRWLWILLGLFLIAQGFGVNLGSKYYYSGDVREPDVLDQDILRPPFEPGVEPPPTVESIELEKNTIIKPCPAGAVSRSAETCTDEANTTVQVQPADPARDPKTYNYAVSGGRIVGEGPKVIWDMSGAEPGTYSIRANINGGAARTESVTVRDCGCEITCNCPKLKVTVSPEQAAPGTPVTFTAELEGDQPQDTTFKWKTDGGRIRTGQGTRQIVVYTGGLNDPFITATVFFKTSGENKCACDGSAEAIGYVRENVFVKISGQVLDHSQNAVPNASVTVSKIGTNFAKTVSSGKKGEFELSVPTGGLEIVIKAKGFKPFRTRTQIGSNGNSRLTLQLSPLQRRTPVQPPFRDPNDLIFRTTPNPSTFLQGIPEARPTDQRTEDDLNHRIVYTYPRSFVAETEGEKTVTLHLGQADSPDLQKDPEKTEAAKNIILSDQYDTYVTATLIGRDGLSVKAPSNTRRIYDGTPIEWEWTVSLTEEGQKQEKVLCDMRLDVQYVEKDTGRVLTNEKNIWTRNDVEILTELPAWATLVSWLSWIFGGLSSCFGFFGGLAIVEDEVECTLYSPPEVRPGNDFLVQIYAHLVQQSEGLDELARELDTEARRQKSEALKKKIRRGGELTFKLAVPGIEVFEDEQTLTWEGEPDSVEFIIPIPPDHKDGARYGRIFVFKDGEKLGKIPFRIQITAQQTASVEPVRAARLTQKESAFVSYASKDKDQVYRFVQLLDVLKYEFHIDIFDIDAGERWEQKLYEFIDTDEVFLLFWSEAASRSEWVVREAKRADERTGRERKNPPRIIIYHLDRPPVPIPEWLGDIQFDRKWAEIIGNIDNQQG